MQINPGSSNGIVDEINSLCDADTTSYPLADKIRRVNIAYEELIGKIISSDGTWEWDDTNQTDLPVGTGTLIEGQESYSFASEYLEIRSIEIKDLNGVYRKIQQVDYSDLGDLSIQEYFGLNTTGFPTHYDILGDTIKLYPAPTSTAVTLAAGLKVRFTRTADLFTTADTTQEPGLPSPYHVLLAYKASLPYCASYKKDRVPFLLTQIQEGEKNLIAFYGHRERDRKKVLSTKPIGHR